MEQRIKDQLTIRLGVMMAGGIVIMAASVKLL
jgi:tetrahydrodipicolinate N-succinyltransferase